MQELRLGLAEASAGSRGHLSLAIVTTANYVMPRLIGQFGRVYPQVELSLFTGNRQEILQRFERNTDDLYIFSHPPASSDAQSLAFLRNPPVVIAPPDYPARNREKAIGFDSLQGERFLLRESGSGTCMSFSNWLIRNGHTLTNRLQVASNEGIFLGVAEGLGLGVISEHVVRCRTEPVRVLPVKSFPLKAQWHLVHKKHQRISSVARVFMDYLRDQLPHLEPEYSLPMAKIRES